MKQPMTTVYLDLVDKVSAIDKDAAYYLRNGARNLRPFQMAGYLAGVMLWYDTPQGHDYWDNINNKLEEEKQDD
jgi:hypothetical protein